ISDDLCVKFGEANPFGKPCENEEKELIRVYKELATVLKERNELEKEAKGYKELRKIMINLFLDSMKKTKSFTIKRESNWSGGWYRFTNNSPAPVRCLIDDTWDPTKSKVVLAGKSAIFEKITSNYFCIAPYISDDPLEGSEHVFKLSKTSDTIEFI
ncbi:hypothetical protein PMAYCL1PPCAC_13783, partial [Pristionchus mayeri]